ncbi:acetyl-CoA carboxylase biotin carboxylase subunit [Anaeromassilibacillus senegalensis]|uniref:biotin carboxylase n=1 Tax=Anaeromassilibacillus senegalensis TaxID=1673717 RepID=A0ABS9CP22_9FIRM|nr:acetyl-CoA carboxylase biotin carboxylase subunit [Anaeromassilibacillus senegalensis]MCF2652880.1 acetyl-CoA carboxylase biotin carboxylase subunit [Anaeromassilibacillus senegalensis]
MFTKLLVANRGEIAVRIIRACKEMGIRTVAVYSKADAESIHVALADEAICIGEAAAKDSYLNQERILSAAIASKAQAIHPGYGFLAENAAFAKLCRKHGIAFVGPSGELIERMGDKDAARRLMQQSGVPTIPGTEILENAEAAKAAAEKIGYPVMLKASAGGGGKGIRLVRTPEEIEQAFNTASSEALRAFGDGRMYMEKYIYPAKHIEVQLLCDEQGHVVCLGERECSIQRNNQKLIEESPSPGVSKEKRRELFDAATKAAKAVGYVNAGTVEFLMDKDKNFYFMEMNTRLQVEHPVSELVTGKDIVKWQIRIAAGVELDCTQSDIKVRGAAIECRINAGGVGKVNFLHIPSGPWVRFDTFLYQGYEVPPFYDSMLGKMIVFSSTREEAIRKMQSALCELVIGGLPNNIENQIDIIRDPVFHSGDYYTDFIKNREG